MGFEGEGDRPERIGRDVRLSCQFTTMASTASHVCRKPSKRKKEKRNVNLLSFGEDAVQEEQQLEAMGGGKKIKSAHDVVRRTALPSPFFLFCAAHLGLDIPLPLQPSVLDLSQSASSRLWKKEDEERAA